MTFAVDWARHITTDLRLFVIILPGAIITTIESRLSDVIHLGFGAMAAKVSSSTVIGNLGIARVVFTPVAHAINGAIWLRARRFRRFIIRRRILAFNTTVCCWGDLHPLAELHDRSLQHRVKARSVAFAKCGPFAHRMNGTRRWLWITRANFHLVEVTALVATKFGFDGDNPVTRLRAFRATFVRALIPFRPIALTVDWARHVLVACGMLEVASLVRALLSTMQRFLCDDVDGLCLTTSTGAATF